MPVRAFLDDVTVQSDPRRTEQILNLLFTLAADRQALLFAQDPMVADWARTSLTAPEHALIELTPVEVI